MRYICGSTDIQITGESVVVLGNFDGVHKGHQRLLHEAKQQARDKDLLAIALSFYPHPTWVLGNNPKPLVMSRQDRKHQMKIEGMDVFIEYPFTIEFSHISPEVFFKNVLVEELHAKVVVVGSNYFFGKNKIGNAKYMQELGQKYNVEILVVDTVKKDGQIISSTHIRQLISEGKMEQAESFLGHPYMVIGTVVHGKKLGRTIGFPTINMIAEPSRIHPPNGVYATTVKVYNQEYMGITNVGYNPTVGSTNKMIETHILNFSGEIYGEEVEVAFHKFIRPEKKFNNVEELSQQIAKDTEIGQNFLAMHMK